MPLTDERLARRVFSWKKNSDAKRPFFLLLFLWASKEKVNPKNKEILKKESYSTNLG
jgi:hypothetical protein